MATGSRLRKLVDQCSLAFDTFKPRRTTVDAHIDEFIQVTIKPSFSARAEALLIVAIMGAHLSFPARFSDSFALLGLCCVVLL